MQQLMACQASCAVEMNLAAVAEIFVTVAQ